jgi:hypothetical protein
MSVPESVSRSCLVIKNIWAYRIFALQMSIPESVSRSCLVIRKYLDALYLCFEPVTRCYLILKSSLVALSLLCRFLYLSQSPEAVLLLKLFDRTVCLFCKFLYLSQSPEAVSSLELCGSHYISVLQMFLPESFTRRSCRIIKNHLDTISVLMLFVPESVTRSCLIIKIFLIVLCLCSENICIRVDNQK